MILLSRSKKHHLNASKFRWFSALFPRCLEIYHLLVQNIFTYSLGLKSLLKRKSLYFHFTNGFNPQGYRGENNMDHKK